MLPFQVVLPVILAVGLGYSPPETAEVVAAKQEFFRAYQQQLAAASASSPNARFNGASAPAAPAARPVSYESYAPAAPAAQPVSYAAQGGAPNYNDGLTYPEAEPYVHQVQTSNELFQLRNRVYRLREYP